MTARREDPPPEPHRAVPELVALVAKMRAEDPYWPPHVVQGVITNAATVGLTWPQVVVGLVRLAVDMDARPGELIPDRNDPTKPGRHDDNAYQRGLAEARAASEAARLRRRSQATP